MIGDASEAEDLTQDAFLQLFRKIRSFRGESALSTWLHRITFNIVLQRFRRKKLGEISLETVDSDHESGKPRNQVGRTDRSLSGLIERLGLTRAINQLPTGCKRMFMLHDVEGYGHDQIAKIIGCSIGNSKSQLHKAHVRLHRLLQEQSLQPREEHNASFSQAINAVGRTRD